MTFTPNTISAGPTYTRERVKTVIGHFTDSVPPNLRIVVNEEGEAEWQLQPALREGQLLFYKDPSDTTLQNPYVEMYVVVTISGELVWKRVSNPISFGDPRTGQDYNQNASFFSILAS